MMLKAFGVVVAILLAGAQGGGTNFSGKWAMPRIEWNGTRTTSFLTINQAGGRVTGTLRSGRFDSGMGPGASAEVFGGKVDGDTITFYIWRGWDRPVKQFYKGVMHGEEIDFTVTADPVPAFVSPNSSTTAAPNQITATRTTE